MIYQENLDFRVMVEIFLAFCKLKNIIYAANRPVKKKWIELHIAYLYSKFHSE